MVHFGAPCVNSVERSVPTRKRSFTVRLEPETHMRLKKIASESQPPLKLQQVVEFAVEKLIREVEGGQMELGLEVDFPRG